MNRARAAFLLLGVLSPTKSFSSISRRSFLQATATTTSTSIMGAAESKSSEKDGKLWDRYAEGYSKQPIADEESYQKKLSLTRQYLRPDMKVVEIGCGTGGTSILHAPFVKHILATDISESMLDIAKRKAAEANVKNIEFRQASVDQLQIPNSSTDVVLGLSILHLLKNKEEAMAKVHGWLKPGGLFVTSTVCASEMGLIPRMAMNAIFPIGRFFGLLPYFSSFTKDELRKSFKGTGFSIECEWQPKKEGSAVFIIGKKE